MPAPATPLTWNDTLLLGDPEMDAVHEEFVALIARLTTAKAPEVANALAALEAHAISHFSQLLLAPLQFGDVADDGRHTTFAGTALANLQPAAIGAEKLIGSARLVVS